MKGKDSQKREKRKSKKDKRALKKLEMVENPPVLGINVKETVKGTDTVR